MLLLLPHTYCLQVTFLCFYHLLDFGSGYEALLQATSRRGAAETIQFGCFGLALSAKRWVVSVHASGSALCVVYL